MEAKKSPNVLSANWETRKPSGIIQFKSESLRTRSSDVKEQEKMDVPALEERNFCSIWFLIGLEVPTHIYDGRFSLLGLLRQMVISSRNT